MRQGFTLIELLVVIILMVVILSLTAPLGSKIFKQFKDYIKKIEVKHQLNQEQALAFIEAREREIILDDQNYTISVKGVMFK
jgi:prepilin-type N-terminal cleavage/methylation domain-containing protein